MKILKINHGKCSMEIDVYAFFPVNQQKMRVLLPMLKSVNASEISELLHTMCEYLAENAAREDTNNRCKSAARMYRANVQTIAAECGVDIPDSFTPDKAACKPDYNYKIEVSKLPRVENVPAPASEINKCIVPLIRHKPSSRVYPEFECYAVKGFGVLLNDTTVYGQRAPEYTKHGIPVYVQQVKSNLYILNVCGQSCPSMQWKTAAAARENLIAAACKALNRPEAMANLCTALELIGRFMDIPAAAPETVKPEAPEAVKPAEISAAVDNTAAEIVPAAAPAETTPAPRKATRRAAPDFVGKQLTAYPRKPKAPEAPKSKPKSKRRNPAEFVGKKMIITIGERAARPAAD